MIEKSQADSRLRHMGIQGNEKGRSVDDIAPKTEIDG